MIFRRRKVRRFSGSLKIIIFWHRKLFQGTKKVSRTFTHFAQWRQRTRNYVAVLLFRREREGVSIRPPRHGGKYKVLTSPYKSTNTLARSRRCTNTSRVEVLLTVCLFCSQRGQLVQGESKISAASRIHILNLARTSDKITMGPSLKMYTIVFLLGGNCRIERGSYMYIRLRSEYYLGVK